MDSYASVSVCIRERPQFDNNSERPLRYEPSRISYSVT